MATSFIDGVDNADYGRIHAYFIGKERINGFAPAAPIDSFTRPRADGIRRDQWPSGILTFHCDRLNHQQLATFEILALDRSPNPSLLRGPGAFITP